MQELIAGSSLDQHLPLPLEDAFAVALQIAEACCVIHRHGIVHCDLKPQNVLLTPERQAVIIDLGIALPAGAQVDTVLGTPHYVARSAGAALRQHPRPMSTPWASSATSCCWG